MQKRTLDVFDATHFGLRVHPGAGQLPINVHCLSLGVAQWGVDTHESLSKGLKWTVPSAITLADTCLDCLSYR